MDFSVNGHQIVTSDAGSGTFTVSGSVAVTNFPAIQPISATSLPLPTGAATSANQTNGTQTTQINNGVSTMAVKSANTPAVMADPAAVVSLSPNRPQTYSTTVLDTTVCTPNPYVSFYFVLKGSATKTTRITALSISGTKTTAGQNQIIIYMGNTISGGTPTALNATPHSSTNAAATAVATLYASGSSPNFAAVASLRTWNLFLPAPSGNDSSYPLIEVFFDTTQAPTLNNANEYFGISILIPSAGTSMTGYIEWTEA